LLLIFGLQSIDPPAATLVVLGGIEASRPYPATGTLQPSLQHDAVFFTPAERAAQNGEIRGPLRAARTKPSGLSPNARCEPRSLHRGGAGGSPSSVDNRSGSNQRPLDKPDDCP